MEYWNIGTLEHYDDSLLNPFFISQFIKTMEKSLLPRVPHYYIVRNNSDSAQGSAPDYLSNKQKETCKMNLNFVQLGVSSLFKLSSDYKTH